MGKYSDTSYSDLPLVNLLMHLMIPPCPFDLFNDATLGPHTVLQRAPELVPKISKTPGSWAGYRLVLLGNYSDNLNPNHVRAHPSH